MTYELCDYQHGTSLRMYDFIRWVMNSLRTTLIEGSKVLNLTAKTINFMYGRDIQVPVFEDGVFLMTEWPEMKWWALRVSWYNNYTQQTTTLGTLPFFKNNLEAIWRAWVAPIDTYLEGSEYFFYRDIDNEFYQGVEFDPVRKFGVLGDGGPASRDMGLITLCIYLLNRVGLFKFIDSFVEKVILYLKDRKLVSNINKIKRQLIDSTASINANVDEVEGAVRSVDAKLGVRLILHP